MIPKHLMQTWKTTTLPSKWAQSQVTFKEAHPDWTYTLMSDTMNEQFVKDHFPEWYTRYINLEYSIQRADIIRYMYLWVYGGYYCDCDAIFLKSLNGIGDLYHDASLLIARNQLGVSEQPSNWFLGSIAHHPFWLICLQEATKVCPWYIKGKHNKVMFTTGSYMIRRALKRYKGTYTLLPKTFLSRDLQGKEKIDRCTFIAPLEGQSWTAWDTQVYKFMFTYRYLLVLLLLGLLLVVLCKKARRRL